MNHFVLPWCAKSDLKWEFLHDSRKQWVLVDIKFAAGGEPDGVSSPVVPGAEGETPGLAPVAPAGFIHLDSFVALQLIEYNNNNKASWIFNYSMLQHFASSISATSRHLTPSPQS